MIITVDVIIVGTGSAAQNVAYTGQGAGWSVAVLDSRPLDTAKKAVWKFEEARA